MQESTFRIIIRPDNIGVIIVDDTSEATLRHWYDYSIADMNTYKQPVKRLYDMRNLDTMSLQAVRMAIKVRKHPNADLIYSAILTSNNTVSALVNVALSVQAGGHFQLFTEENLAIAWLHQKVPD
ncbi:MAG: hypothetical protein KBA85_03450 [Chloroflexi bacterium]|nr:hypothetical protein [Chloroflexota bacterium]